MIIKKRSREQGIKAEIYAKDYLQNQGLKFIEANFHSRFGEIDLIMRDRESLVFIEVRLRKSSTYGSASASVSYFKQEKLRKAALFYLMKYKLYEKIPCRFDVFAMQGTVENPQIEWIKNAF